MTHAMDTSLEITRCFTQAEFNAFAALSGDDNPIHVDPAFAARTRFGHTVAHGMLLYSALCGILSRAYPGARQEAQQMMFAAPTYADEQITYRITPTGRDGARLHLLTVVTNAAGEIKLDGSTTLWLATEDGD